MAKFRRMTTLNTLLEVGLIPLFYEKDIDKACHIVEACLDGGARLIEFTNRGDGAYRVYEAISQRFEDDPRLIFGAGSIIDPGTAAFFLQMGANFIVGPTLNPDIAFVCNQRKVPYLPGCGTANEIAAAEKVGTEICKIFPGEAAGGPSFVKSVLGPMPWSSLMPTGGVEYDEANVRSWFESGVVAIGMGSNLISKSDVSKGNYESISGKVKTVLGWITEIRSAKQVKR